MLLSNDLRQRVVEAVVEGGLSRYQAAKRFKASIASAVRCVQRYCVADVVSPKPSGGDRRSLAPTCSNQPNAKIISKRADTI